MLKNVEVGIFSVTANHRVTKLSIVILYVDLYKLVQFSVTVTYFEGHKSLENPEWWDFLFNKKSEHTDALIHYRPKMYGRAVTNKFKLVTLTLSKEASLIP